jgi:hypothetical protein
MHVNKIFLQVSSFQFKETMCEYGKKKSMRVERKKRVLREFIHTNDFVVSRAIQNHPPHIYINVDYVGKCLVDSLTGT